MADNPASYTYDQVKVLPGEQRLITIYCVEGWDATILWKGVTMKTLLDAAGVQQEANTVIFHAVDGYTTSLPLQEILDNDLMLAYDANGIALPPEMGYPFIFVAEDKWGYKWLSIDTYATTAYVVESEDLTYVKSQPCLYGDVTMKLYITYDTFTNSSGQKFTSPKKMTYTYVSKENSSDSVTSMSLHYTTGTNGCYVRRSPAR
jgi:hypothetical protein